MKPARTMATAVWGVLLGCAAIGWFWGTGSGPSTEVGGGGAVMGVEVADAGAGKDGKDQAGHRSADAQAASAESMPIREGLADGVRGDPGGGGGPRSADEWAGMLREQQGQDSLRADSLGGGADLLAVPTPQVERLANILRDAGVDEHEVVTGIRELHGHVLRLEQFARFVREASEEPKSPVGTAAGAEPGQDKFEPREWPRLPNPLAAAFTERLVEYERYARRSMITRFGFKDAGVADRLIGVAYATVPRPPVPGVGATPGPGSGAGGPAPTSP